MKRNIIATISDLCMDFCYYDRKEDEDLSGEKLKEAIRSGVITIDEMVAEFRKHLVDTFADVTIPLSKNPYCDEVFSTRLNNIIKDYCIVNGSDEKLQLSGCPRLSTLEAYAKAGKIRGFGMVTRNEFFDTMTEYGFTDKLK